MRKILVILLFLGVLNLYTQERTDLIDRHFQGEITKRAAGDSINTKQYIFVTFLKDKAIIREEKLTITKQPRLIYKVEVAWRINKRNNQIIFSASNKPYPYQDYKFYYREEELMAFYNEDDDGTMGLDIYFTEK